MSFNFTTPRPVASPPRPQSLYFAYGSNLQLKQMAKRCPDSQFQGRARLHNFRWQINERGFANVIPAPNAVVEGLCYLLSAEDEARLDRSEGVPTGAYQKNWTEVEFFPASAKLLGRKVTEIIRFNLMEREGAPSEERGGLPGPTGGIEPVYRAQGPRALDAGTPVAREITEHTYFIRDGRTEVMEQTGSSRRRGQSVPARNHSQTEGRPSANFIDRSHGEPARVLVYLSQNHIKEGLPWDEYVERMSWGIFDAVDLGISQQYVEKAITPYLEAVTGFNPSREPRGRGVRERKKRPRHVVTKKQRRNGAAESEQEQYRELAMIQAEPMEWDVTQEQYHEYQGS